MDASRLHKTIAHLSVTFVFVFLFVFLFVLPPLHPTCRLEIGARQRQLPTAPKGE